MGFFEKVQKSASALAWSQGVEMARYGAVIPERASDDEIAAHRRDQAL